MIYDFKEGEDVCFHFECKAGNFVRITHKDGSIKMYEVVGMYSKRNYKFEDNIQRYVHFFKLKPVKLVSNFVILDDSKENKESDSSQFTLQVYEDMKNTIKIQRELITDLRNKMLKKEKTIDCD